MKIHIEVIFQNIYDHEDRITETQTIDDSSIADANMCIEIMADEYSEKGYRRTWKEISMECFCGEMVVLDAFTNECYKCGALYNRSGQTLSNPEEWGWETGELPCECW